MTRRIFIIRVHPDLDGGHPIYAKAAVAAGHRVVRFGLLDISLLRREEAFEREPPPPALLPVMWPALPSVGRKAPGFRASCWLGAPPGW
jgi:hypothetical protein